MKLSAQIVGVFLSAVLFVIGSMWLGLFVAVWAQPAPPTGVGLGSGSTATLTVTPAGTGSGTVTGPGISCGSDCTEAYPTGVTTVLSAAAASGSTFSGWSGACSGTGTCSVTMSSAQAVTATFALTAVACNYYASPTGSASNSGLSSSVPFRPADFWALGQATMRGKTLCLMDGEYTGSAFMIEPTSGISGTSTNKITVAALNESGSNCGAGVCINGQFARKPLYLNGNSWWVVQGINFKNAGPSNAAVGGITENSNDNVLSRVIFWDANSDENNTCLQIINSSRNTIQDFAVFGVCRFSVNPTTALAGSGTGNVFDRGWVRWEGSTVVGPKGAVVNAYGGAVITNTTFQNMLITWSPLSMPQSYTLGLGGTAYISSGLDGANTCVRQGDNSWNCSNYGIQSAGGISHNEGNDNDILGTVMSGVLVYIREGDVTFLGANATNAYPLAMAYHINSDNQTFNSAYYFQHSSMPSPTNIVGLFLGVGVTTSGNSLLRATAVRSGVDSINWTTVSPAIASATTLAGLPGTANIFTSSVNANLCFLWNGTTQTSTKMWPWIMEDRIAAATAAAGTYSGGTCLNCSGSRQARTAVNVTTDIEGMFGTIPAACRN